MNKSEAIHEAEDIETRQSIYEGMKRNIETLIDKLKTKRQVLQLHHCQHEKNPYHNRCNICGKENYEKNT